MLEARIMILVLSLSGIALMSALILSGCAGMPDSDKHIMTADDYDDIRPMLDTMRGPEL